jgi:hypothetical protein
MVAIALCMLQWRGFEKTLAIGGATLKFGAIDLAVVLAGLFTLVSGFGYVVGGIAQLHAKGHGDPKSWNEF